MSSVFPCDFVDYNSPLLVPMSDVRGPRGAPEERAGEGRARAAGRRLAAHRALHQGGYHVVTRYLLIINVEAVRREVRPRAAALLQVQEGAGGAGGGARRQSRGGGFGL